VKLGTALATTLSLAAALASTTPAQAHCDTLDGPVVSAARKALETGNVNLALVWVQKQDEGEIRTAFERARKVRRAGADARDLADMYFFETLVRTHRAGEGAAYAGLKPAGAVEPPVAAADKALGTGKLQGLAKLVVDETERGLHGHFEQVMARKGFDPNDVEAGRAYAGAYVEFVHYAERLYDSAKASPAEHAHKAEAAHLD
jgi:hypothetical protein